MYGSSIGSLNVYLNISNRLTLWWRKSGSKGNVWKQGTVGIGKKIQPFQVVIQGENACFVFCFLFLASFFFLKKKDWSSTLFMILILSQYVAQQFRKYLRTQLMLLVNKSVQVEFHDKVNYRFRKILKQSAGRM